MSQPRDHSAGKISFSWENKPGVSKVTHSESLPREQEFSPKLPPPPCTAEAATASTRNPVHGFQIPLPPCAFQPPYYRTSSKKGLWVQDEDPFMTAHKECIKNEESAERNKKLTKGGGVESWLRKCMSYFSCKRSCIVHNNNLVSSHTTWTGADV